METTFKARVSVAWWVKPYLRSIAVFAGFIGIDIDVDKALHFAMKGVRVKVDK